MTQRRIKAEKEPLSKLEEDEEEDEVLRYAKQFHNDDFRDEELFAKISKTQIEDFDMLVNSLHVDVCISMIRNEIKDGIQREQKKAQKTDAMREGISSEVQLIKEQQGLQGIADNLIKKINLMNESHSKKIKINAYGLQISLQNAGSMDTPKPQMADYEKKLIKEANENTYMGALLKMVLAMNRSLDTEQRQLLLESLGILILYHRTHSDLREIRKKFD